MQLAWQVAKMIKHVFFIFDEPINCIQTLLMNFFQGYTGNADKLQKKNIQPNPVNCIPDNCIIRFIA